MHLFLQLNVIFGFTLQYSVNSVINTKTKSNKPQIISILRRKDLISYILDNEAIGNY